MNTNTDSQKSVHPTPFPYVCIAVGFVFLFFPSWVVGTLSLLLGVLCAAFGGGKIIHAVTSVGFTRVGSVLAGVAAMVLGLYIITHTEEVFALLPIAAGVFFFLDGLDRIRSAMKMRRMEKSGHIQNPPSSASVQTQKRRFLTTLIIGTVTLGCGAFLLLFPFHAVTIAVRVIGAFILADGVGALWTEYALRDAVRMFASQNIKQGADGKYNADFRDISDRS